MSPRTRAILIGALVAAAVILAAGCCTPPPARLDQKKVDAYLDEVASAGSVTFMWIPAELQAPTRAAWVKIGSDGRELLGR